MTPEEAYSLKVIPEVRITDKGLIHVETSIENFKYKNYIFLNKKKITNEGYEILPSFHEGYLYYVKKKKKKAILVRQAEYGSTEELVSTGNIVKYAFHRKGILIVSEEETKDSKAPFYATKIKYRFDGRGLFRTRLSLFLFDGKLRKLVSGDFDVFDVATNGNRVVIASTKENDDIGLSDIYEVDVETGELKRITQGEGIVSTVAMNEGGKIAYLGHRKGRAPWATSQIILPEEGKVYECGKNCGNHVLTDLFDGVKDKVVYEKDVIITEGQEGGEVNLYEISDGKVSKITQGEIVIRTFDYRDGKLAYVYSTPTKPVIMYYEGEAYDPNPNVEGLSPIKVNTNGIEGWAIITSNENPTILFIHGGPHAAYGYGYFIEFQFFAKNGFNVIYCNPRGSQGYGEDFAKACVGDWGGKDMEDILNFTKYVIMTFGLKGKLGVTGGSYGGYMTNWIITKTDMFSAAISERSISNLVSMCGTSDIGFWFNVIEAGIKDPWDQESQLKLMRVSPIFYVKNVKTPIMLIHGEEDYRCPIEQAEQFYTAVKMIGVDAMLVRYQGDGHEHARKGNPKNMIDRLRIKLEWFNKYLKGNS